ncbi:MAG: helix-turn-helix transcriptional regulator [Thermosynechococcaceae cyanobacterium]
MARKVRTISDPVKRRWSELVRKTRLQFDETQVDFARRFDLAGQSVQQWESQGNLPKFASLSKMAELLGCSADDLNRYLNTGTEFMVQEFDSQRTLAQLRSQDPAEVADFIRAASDILVERLKAKCA